jgi:hypothetical protein
MNGHWSSEAMERALASELGSEIDARSAAHMAVCATCAEELRTMRRVLGGVREDAVNVAGRERLLAEKPLVRSAGRRWQGWVVAACAVVLLAVGVPVARHRHAAVVAVATAAKGKPAEVVAENSISDEALLNDVASDLSTSVPQPLAPLAVTSGTSGSAERSASGTRLAD